MQRARGEVGVRSFPYHPIRRLPDCLEDESDITFLQPQLTINRPTQFLVVVRKESEGSPGSAAPSEAAVIHRNDFVLLTDDTECSTVGIKDISLLEAHRNFTLVHVPDGKLLIRRSLADCERRLDSSIFFRADRGCIFNLSHVKQSRFLEDGGLIFILRDGKEVVLSRRQTVLFRKTRGL
jgi:two-component system LytT family response regulator